MGITGKYDFPGIKKYGARGLETALSSIPWLAPVFKIPVIGTFARGFLELFSNFLANEGLVLLNIGAAVGEGELDQAKFDQAVDQAVSEIHQPGTVLTPEKMKQIDQGVIDAARKFIVISRTS